MRSTIVLEEREVLEEAADRWVGIVVLVVGALLAALAALAITAGVRRRRAPPSAVG
jgi:hypothetical protein